MHVLSLDFAASFDSEHGLADEHGRVGDGAGRGVDHHEPSGRSLSMCYALSNNVMRMQYAVSGNVLGTC